MSERKRTPQDYLVKWGFSNSKSLGLLSHADLCAQYAEHRVGAIVAALGLTTTEEIEAVMQDKPSNMLTLEFLASAIPVIREQSLKVLAISRGLAYMETIEDKWVKEGASLSDAARVSLDTMNAAYLLTQDNEPMIVFSELNRLLSFAQSGRREREKDPLRQAIGKEPIVALAPPSIVVRASKGYGSAEQSIAVNTAHQDNYWSSSLAKTEAEKILGRLVDEALTRKATDIAFQPLRNGTLTVLVRIAGDLMPPERYAILSPEIAKEVVNFLISKSGAGEGGRLRAEADGMIAYKNSLTEAQMRCSFIPAARHGLDIDMISVSVRLFALTSRRIDLEKLKLNPELIRAIRQVLIKTQGLILLAGPTNSGKSTTIAGIVGEHIEMYGSTRKRISLEEPVERYLDDITQVEVHKNFANLMRALLRHDPDLVWVGEIRDPFSAAACIRAASSGHIVLGTVHANDSILAYRAVANYLHSSSQEEMGATATTFDLSEALALTIGQRLVQNVCSCSTHHMLTVEEWKSLEEYYASEGYPELFEKAKQKLAKGVRVKNAAGCKACKFLGHKGDIPINEFLPATRAVKELYSKSDKRLEYSQIAKHRPTTLAESVLELVAKGGAEFGALFI